MKQLFAAAGLTLCLLTIGCQNKKTAQQETPAPATVQPAAIAADTSANKTAEAGYYTCPMHPEVHQAKPGNCPICGMTLVFKKEADTTALADSCYMCPMHPAVRKSKPGTCPICNMNLVLKKTEKDKTKTPGTDNLK
jgi:hypothetical protein